MRTSKTIAAAALTIGVLWECASAHATLMVNALVGGAPTGVSYVNFDNLSTGSSGGVSGGVTVSFTPDAQVVVGASSGIYAAPFISNSNGVLFGDATPSGADTTKYLTSGSTGQVAGAGFTLVMPGQEMYLGLLWGSVDAYNTLQFFNGNTLVGTLTGANVTASANGDQGVNGTYYVNINSDLSFNRVVATSTQYAFEIDNVAYNPTQVPVPEPATLALLGAGLLGVGALRRRRKSA